MVDVNLNIIIYVFINNNVIGYYYNNNVKG